MDWHFPEVNYGRTAFPALSEIVGSDFVSTEDVPTDIGSSRRNSKLCRLLNRPQKYTRRPEWQPTLDATR